MLWIAKQQLTRNIIDAWCPLCLVVSLYLWAWTSVVLIQRSMVY